MFPLLRSSRIVSGALAAFVAATFALPTGMAAQDGEPSRIGSGALRVGDRIVLSVADEPTLTDTFTVTSGPALELPLIGVISLAGVTRGDVQRHLTSELGRVIKDPVVTARTLVRVAVLGQVARPGFFALPADALLSDAITAAGGPTSDADMKKVSLSRRGSEIQSGSELRNSIAEGMTLDALGMEAGDEVMIPRRHDSERTIRILSLIVAIPLTVFALTRM